MISIAIDGPSGAGKSTIARRAAALFGFIYVDTGAIYRTIGLAAHNRGIDTKNSAAVIELLPTLSIDMKYDRSGEQVMLLDGCDVSGEIRRPDISMCASNVSAIPEVRAFLMDMQRNMAASSNVIMDGRDIGTVILPDADLKIFLTANVEERAKRRFNELKAKGIETDLKSVVDDMIRRDDQDTNRAAAPLVPAEDAVIVDTSGNSLEESIEIICALISEKTGAIPRETGK